MAAGAVAIAGRLGDGRFLRAAVFGFGAVFFFGFAALPRIGRVFGRARLVALREPADFAFRRLVRVAMSADPSEVGRRIKNYDNGDGWSQHGCFTPEPIWSEDRATAPARLVYSEPVGGTADRAQPWVRGPGPRRRRCGAEGGRHGES